MGYGFSQSFRAGTSLERRTSGAKALVTAAFTARLKPCPSYSELSVWRSDKSVSGSKPSSGLELLHQRLKVHIIPAFDDLVALDNGEG
jgi:hypothetical protein